MTQKHYLLVVSSGPLMILTLIDRVDAAYAGARDKVPRFWLYDWRGDSFKLVRAATEVGG